MKASQEAILRCATRINSFIPSRIVGTDLKLVGREGDIKINFDYQGKAYEFIVPFTRPYLNKADHVFANLLNLNQKRKENNQLFQEFIIKITQDYSVIPAIEIPCRFTLLSKGGSTDLDDPSPVTVPNNPPQPPSLSASASQNFQFDDSQTHYIVFAEMSPDSFFNRKLAKYFDEYTLKEMFTKVNSSYECGSTYRPGNKAPFVTILPLFDQFKRNQTEDQFLQGIFNDIVKSQNQYFKKPTICMVYSSQGFPNRSLFEEGWYMVVKQLTFSGYAKFIAE